MKKIMIITTVIIMSVVANAATFSWTGRTVYGSDLLNKYTGSATIYAYLTSAGASEAFVATSAATIVEGQFKTSNGDGTYTNGYSENILGITAVQGGDNVYSFYFTIVDDGKTFTSSVVTAEAQQTATVQVAFSGLADATKNAANWTTAAVPEPTSGLLLLCGLAGLALRRKKA